MRALIYARVSSERQKNEGHGLDSQEHRCIEYAKARGWEVERVFKDTYTGGGDFMKRPAMKELLEYANLNAHKDYVVIFDDLKRLSRDIVNHWLLRDTFKKMGVALASPNFEFKEDDEQGWLHESITAVFNEYERKTNRRQVIQKQKARIEGGYWAFYPPPGYHTQKDPIHGKLLVRKEPEATIIQEALEGFASGRFESQADVHLFLQDKDFRKGKQVSFEDVSRILNRPIYCGDIEYLPWDVSRRKGHHEGLISRETYALIEDKLRRKEKTRDRKDYNPDFPLRGKIFCSVCRRPFTASWSKGHTTRVPYYRCNNAKCTNRNKSIRRDALEPAFEKLLKRITPSGNVIALARAIFTVLWSKKVSDLKGEEMSAEKRKIDLQTQIDKLIDKAASTDSLEIAKAYEQRIQTLKAEQAELVATISKPAIDQKTFETCFAYACDYLKQPYDIWKNGDLDEKRLVFKLAFNRELVYSLETGFETPEISSVLKVFELISHSNSQDVEIRGRK